MTEPIGGLITLADWLGLGAGKKWTHALEVRAAEAEGKLFIEEGQVVHAWFGDLVGTDAVYAMIESPTVRFSVGSAGFAVARTVNKNTASLLIEAAQLRDERRLPAPTSRLPHWPEAGGAQAPLHPGVASEQQVSDHAFFGSRPGTLSAAPVVRPLAQSAAPESLRRWSRVLMAALVLAVVLPVVFLWRASVSGNARQDQRSAAARTEQAVREPVEASELPAEQRPSWLSGQSAMRPPVKLALAPTIVVRLRLSRDGVVESAHVQRSRPEVLAFEERAVAAAKTFRFRPATVEGLPVSAFINWPVTFQAPGERLIALNLKGSDTIGAKVAPDWARAFEGEYGVKVTVEALGSSTGFSGLFDGTAEVAMASRPASSAELARASELGLVLKEFLLGYDGISILVHPSSPLTELSIVQVAEVFSGKHPTLRSLGVESHRVPKLFGRPTYSGTHAYFLEEVLRGGETGSSVGFSKAMQTPERSEEIVEIVAKEPDAIGFVSLGAVDGRVRPLAIRGAHAQKAVLPSEVSVQDATYPISRPLLLYTRGAPHGAVADFLRFVLSERGQLILAQHHFTPARTAPDAVALALRDVGNEQKSPEVVRVPFRLASAELDPAARYELATAATRIKQGPYRVLIVGNSDGRGDPEKNKRLAWVRADAVARFLLAHGVRAQHIQVDDSGPSEPVASNETPLGRDLNRRVEIYLIPIDAKAAREGRQVAKKGTVKRQPKLSR